MTCRYKCLILTCDPCWRHMRSAAAATSFRLDSIRAFCLTAAGSRCRCSQGGQQTSRKQQIQVSSNEGCWCGDWVCTALLRQLVTPAVLYCLPAVFRQAPAGLRLGLQWCSKHVHTTFKCRCTAAEARRNLQCRLHASDECRTTW
jgi:hypothetical protein